MSEDRLPARLNHCDGDCVSLQNSSFKQFAPDRRFLSLRIAISRLAGLPVWTFILLLVSGLTVELRGETVHSTQSEAITGQVRFGALWERSRDGSTTAWLETRFSVPKALGWMRAGNKSSQRLELPPEERTEQIAISDDGKLGLIVLQTQKETVYRWVDLIAGKFIGKRSFPTGTLTGEVVFALGGKSVLALRLVKGRENGLEVEKENDVRIVPITSTAEAVRLGLAEPATHEEAVKDALQYVIKNNFGKIDQGSVCVIEVPMDGGPDRELGRELDGGLQHTLMRSPNGEGVLVISSRLKGITISYLTLSTGATTQLESPVGIMIPSTTFLEDGRLLLRDTGGFTLMQTNGADRINIALPKTEGASLAREFKPLRPDYSRKPLGLSRPVEIGKVIYFLDGGAIYRIDLSGKKVDVQIFVKSPRIAFTSLMALKGRLFVDTWDLENGTGGLSEISSDGAVKPLWVEHAIIFLLGTTDNLLLTVRQDGNSPSDLLAIDPERLKVEPFLATQLNPLMNGLPLGRLEKIGSHVLLRPSVSAPSSGGYPIVVFAYPNEKPEEIPEAFDTCFNNLPRRLALLGIASLFADVRVQPTDRPDSNPSREMVEGSLQAVDEALKTGGLNEKRLGFMGWSYGGYMAYCLASGSDRFSALVAGAGYLDPVLSYTGNGDQAMLLGDQTSQGGLGGPPWKVKERYLAAGPLWRIEAVKAPILILVGSDDKRVPVSESEQAFRVLRRADKPAVLRVFPGGGHNLSNWPEKQQLALAQSVEEWFKKTLIDLK